MDIQWTNTLHIRNSFDYPSCFIKNELRIPFLYIRILLEIEIIISKNANIHTLITYILYYLNKKTFCMIGLSQ